MGPKKSLFQTLFTRSNSLEFSDLNSFYSYNPEVRAFLQNLLSADDLKMIEIYYCQDNLKPKTLKQVSAALGKSDHYCRGRHSKVINVLRHPEHLSKLAALLGLWDQSEYFTYSHDTKIVNIFVAKRPLRRLFAHLQEKRRVTCLEQIAAMKYSDFFLNGNIKFPKFHYFGRGSYKNLRDLLRKHGLDFAPEEK